MLVLNVIIGLHDQSIATFFSQVMAAVGGNTAGPGTERTI